MTTSIHVMLNEAYKSLLHLWSYRYNTLAEMVQRGLSFLAIGLLLGKGHWEAAQMAFILCGWIMTFYARTILFQVNERSQPPLAHSAFSGLLLRRLALLCLVRTFRPATRVAGAILSAKLFPLTQIRLRLIWVSSGVQSCA